MYDDYVCMTERMYDDYVCMTERFFTLYVPEGMYVCMYVTEAIICPTIY